MGTADPWRQIIHISCILASLLFSYLCVLQTPDLSNLLSFFLPSCLSGFEAMARLRILVYLAIFLSSIQSGVIACDEHNNGTLSDGSGVRVGSPNNATLPAPPKSHKAHPPQKNNLPKESPKNPPFVSDEDPDCGEAGPPTPSPSPPAGNSSTPSLPESPPAEGPAPSPSPPTGKSPTSNPPENPPCERPPAKGRARPSPLPPADKPAPPVANNEPVPTPTLVKKPAPSPIPEEINTAPSPIPVQLISSSTSEEATSQSDVDAYLESHNAFRAKHGAAPLVWNEELASKAKQWSANCKMEHSGGTLGPYGG